MIPKLFDQAATDFSGEGVGPLPEATGCTVREELNGSYELTLELPAESRHFAQIAPRSIILAKANDADPPQPFRIYRETRPTNLLARFYARHLSYDLDGIPVAPFSAANAAQAAQRIKSYSVTANPFSFSTTVSKSAAMEVKVPCSARSLLGENEQSLLKIYGGELKFERFSVQLLAQRGADRGFSIEYGVNLTDVSQEKNIGELYTGVLPYWTDGENTVSGSVQSAAGTFSFSRILPVDLSADFEEEPTAAQLNAAGQDYITREKIGVPKVSIRASFVPAAALGLHAPAALQLGDTVRVRFARLGIDAVSSVTGVEYDSLRERYLSVEIGERPESAASAIADAGRLRKGTIPSERFGRGSVGGGAIKKGSITEKEIQPAAITGKLIAAAAVGSAKLAAWAVKKANIDLGAVGTEQLEDGAVVNEKIGSSAVTEGKLGNKAVTKAKIGDGAVDSDQLAANAVTEGKIGSGAVTGDKLGNKAVSKAKIGDGAVDSDQLAANAVTEGKIGNKAVSKAKIGDGAVDSDQLAANAVTEGKIGSGAVTGDKLGNKAVSKAKIGDGAVDSDQLAANAVTEGKIGSGAVTEGKIGTGAVTVNKLGNKAVSKAKIDDGAVDSDQLAANAVTEGKIGSGAVTEGKIGTGAVTTNKLGSKAVSKAKIGDGAVDSDQLAANAVTEGKIGTGAVTVNKLGSKAVSKAKIGDKAVDTGQIEDSAVSYGKTSFTGTLDQVGVNKSNIETIQGYFTGSASFSYLQCQVFALGGAIVNTVSIIDGNGNVRSGFLQV